MVHMKIGKLQIEMENRWESLVVQRKLNTKQDKTGEKEKKKE